jgi:multiple sugar transport system permease protein
VICPLRDLEDDAVHVAAAAGGLGADPDDYLESAKVEGATAWPAVRQGDRAEHEGRDHGRAAVQAPGRVPHLDNVFIMTRVRKDRDAARSSRTTNDHPNHDRHGVCVSVILAILVVLIAVLFVKGFKTDLSQQMGS